MTLLRWQDILGLFVLAIPIACIARTVIFEEVFREPREWCKYKSERCRGLLQRKFFYIFTCEYCFSHWVTLLTLIVTRYKLMYDDWKGYVIAFFSLVFVANGYINLYSRLRVDITSEKKEIEAKEKAIVATQMDIEAKDREIQKLDAELVDVQNNGGRGGGAGAAAAGDGRKARR
jgi:hypothetical protein